MAGKMTTTCEAANPDDPTMRCVRVPGHTDYDPHHFGPGPQDMWTDHAPGAAGNGPRSGDWEPDVSEALEAIGAAVGAAVGPLAMAFQEVRQASQTLTRDLVALQESHAALLDLLDRSGVQPSWAQDRDILESARALRDRLKP